MKLKYSKEEEVQMIRYLCFRNEDPTRTRYTFMDLKSIAKFLGKSTAYVHKICTELRKGKYRDDIVDSNNSRRSQSFERYKVNKKKHFTQE